MNSYASTDLSLIYNRVIRGLEGYVIKVGTNVLKSSTTGEVDREKIRDISNQAADLYENKKRVIIVTSGAIGTGREAVGATKEQSASLHQRQALAAIGQPDLMGIYKEYLAERGLLRAQIQPSYYDLQDPEHLENILGTVQAAFGYRAIPIFNENDAVSVAEIKPRNGEAENGAKGTVGFGDNDKHSVMAAKALNMDVIFFLTEKDGLLDYGSKPKRKIHVLDDPYDALPFIVEEEKSIDGTGGGFSKLEATINACESGIFVVWLGGRNMNAINRALSGEPLGTLFLPKNFKYNRQG